jgi:hypothetical protein
VARRSRRKRWSDLSGGQRIAVVAAGVVQVSLLVRALWDLAHRPSDQVRGNKLAWAAACFVNFVGPVAYLRFGRRR